MQYKAFVPLMMLPPVENSVIQPLAENSKEAKSCNLLIMADSRALGQKIADNFGVYGQGQTDAVRNGQEIIVEVQKEEQGDQEDYLDCTAGH